MSVILEGNAYPSDEDLVQTELDTKLDVEIVNTFTQTYATATTTHANPTATALTSAGVSANNTLVTVDTGGISDVAKVDANFDDVADEINKLIVDLANLKGVVNALINAEQARGLSG